MRRLCYLGILKEGFLAYSSPVMLISRKMTSDKRVVTNFRHYWEILLHYWEVPSVRLCWFWI